MPVRGLRGFFIFPPEAFLSFAKISVDIFRNCENMPHSMTRSTVQPSCGAYLAALWPHPGRKVAYQCSKRLPFVSNS